MRSFIKSRALTGTMVGVHESREKNRHDPFRSEGERQIALWLERLSIPYRYEHPMAIFDRGKVRLWYPDFLLPEYGIVLEYAGMEKNGSYERALLHKRAVYAGLGLSVIYIHPGAFRGFWPRRLASEVEGILAGRLKAFHTKVSEEFSRRDRRRANPPADDRASS